MHRRPNATVIMKVSTKPVGPTVPRTMLIAIGGNSLIRAGEKAGVGTERAHVAGTCRAIAQLVAGGWRVVLTHGNVPQVGAALLRS